MDNLRFTEAHEWIRLEEDNIAVIGITGYAQGELGDVVYVELPELDKILCKDDSAAIVESVKTASEIKMPLTARVLSVNESLQEEPELVNMDPEGDGWLFMISDIDIDEFNSLMNEDKYNEFLSGL